MSIEFQPLNHQVNSSEINSFSLHSLGMSLTVLIHLYMSHLISSYRKFTLSFVCSTMTTKQ